VTAVQSDAEVLTALSAARKARRECNLGTFDPAEPSASNWSRRTSPLRIWWTRFARVYKAVYASPYEVSVLWAFWSCGTSSGLSGGRPRRSS
jgi:hypothetical protein